MEEVYKKNKLTQWGSQILTSILTSQMMVTKNPQNVHRKYFWAILMTFISDIKIDVNMCEPHYVNLFFLWTSSIVQMFDFLTFGIFLTTWHLFDILTHQWNLNHLSLHRAIFVNLLHSPNVWPFDISHLLNLDTYNLNHLSPHRAIFSLFIICPWMNNFVILS